MTSRKQNYEIIDLCDVDDDVAQQSKSFCSSASTSRKKTAPSSNTTVIDLCGPNDENQKPPALATNNDEVKIIDPPPAPVLQMAEPNSFHSDNEIAVLGTTNTQVFTHARYDCPVHPLLSFDAQKYCKKCCCFLCGVEASNCPDWGKHCAVKNLKEGMEMRRELDKQEALRKNKEAAELKKKKEEEKAKEAEAERQRSSRARMDATILHTRKILAGEDVPELTRSMWLKMGKNVALDDRRPSSSSPGTFLAGQSIRTSPRTRASNIGIGSGSQSDSDDDDNDVLYYQPFAPSNKRIKTTIQSSSKPTTQTIRDESIGVGSGRKGSSAKSRRNQRI